MLTLFNNWAEVFITSENYQWEENTLLCSVYARDALDAILLMQFTGEPIYSLYPNQLAKFTTEIDFSEN